MKTSLLDNNWVTPELFVGSLWCRNQRGQEVDVCWGLTGTLRQDIYQISASKCTDYIDFLVWLGPVDFMSGISGKNLFCLLSISKTIFKMIYFKNVWSLLILLSYIFPVLSLHNFFKTLKSLIIKVKHSNNLVKDRLFKVWKKFSKPYNCSFFFYHTHFIKCAYMNKMHTIQRTYFPHTTEHICYRISFYILIKSCVISDISKP